MEIVTNILLVLLLIVCCLLVTVVLMQRSKNDGLAGGAAFGGGFTDAFFGAGTATVLVRITTWLGGIFFALSLLLAVLYSHQYSKGTTGSLKKIVSSTNGVSKASATNAVSSATNAAPAASTNAPAKVK
jgi:preprotein translocase subunit SecG